MFSRELYRGAGLNAPVAPLRKWLVGE
jgi:hypothetical protein